MRNNIKTIIILLGVSFLFLSPIHAAIETPDTITTGANTSIPVVLGNEVQGGYMTVMSLAERDTIADGRRAEGMLCYVREENKTYRLVQGSWAEEAGGYWKGSGNNISNVNTGNVGVGTMTPEAKLDIKGDIKLAGISSANMPAATPGRVYYNSDTKRLSYYGDKWVEIDPAYTDKPTLTTNPKYAYGTSSVELIYASTGSDMIITSVTGFTNWQTNQNPAYMIEVTDGANVLTSFIHWNTGDKEFYHVLPIPVKVKVGVTVHIKATAIDYFGNAYAGTVVYLSSAFNYIKLPL